MANDKFDLPGDLLSLKSADLSSSWSSKDQLAMDNSIPLSPQWLYGKTSESKVGISGMSGETHPENSLPHINSIDVQKDNWRLDGYENKERKIASDIDSMRQWREEERETSLLGRRDRGKDDRRAENYSSKENADFVPNRNSGLETRGDSKWSSRWGSDDKEKDSRVEKRLDVEKDENHYGKQLLGSSRAIADRETDSHDKWRPRHRLENHSSGSSVYRAAPGFGRGKLDCSNVGFAPGRGRSSSTFSPSLGKVPSVGPIGALSVDELAEHGLPTESFCYPRGKLLDIYRKQKLLASFDNFPVGLGEVSSITQFGYVEPLAFVAPNAEEKDALIDISKGKIISSEVLPDSPRDKLMRCGGSVTAVHSYQREGRDCFSTTDAKVNESSSVREFDGNLYNDILSRSSTSLKNATQNSESSTSFNMTTNVQGTTDPLFDPSTLQKVSNSNEQNLKSNGERNMLGRTPPLEELRLYYRDPQGEVQGPFLGCDIISWFDQGFFGTDLPVCLSDAPEGTPFQELGKVMTQFKLKACSDSTTTSLSEIDSRDAVVYNPDPPVPHVVPDSIASTVTSDQKWAASEFERLSSNHDQSRISKFGDPVEPHYSEVQRFHEFIAQNEEVALPGRPESSSMIPTRKSSIDLHDNLTNSTRHPFLGNDVEEGRVPQHKDNQLHPFGLLRSELESAPSRHIQSLSNPSASHDQSHFMNLTDGGDASLFNRTQSSFGAMTDKSHVGDAWADSFRRNILSNSNAGQDYSNARKLSHMEHDSNSFDLAEQLMTQESQQQAHRKSLLSSRSGSFLEQPPSSTISRNRNLFHHEHLVNQPTPDLEHLLKIRLQRERQFQLQQQLLQQQQLQQLQQQQQLQQLQQQQQQLQQRQHFKVQQFALEQMLQQQLRDPGFGQSMIDQHRGNNMLDQILLRQQHPHELQQHHRPSPRHADPTLEQLVQAKIAQRAQQDQQNRLLELLSRAKRGQGQLQPLERHGLQQEQLQARQFSMALRQQMEMDEERRIAEGWSVDGTDQFNRTVAGPHRALSAGMGSLDLYQQQQKHSSFEEQMSHFERNLTIQERLQQRPYEPSPLPFERSASLPVGARGMNLDSLDPLPRAQVQDMQGWHTQMHVHSQQNQVPAQFDASHLDAIGSQWSETNGRQGNIWFEDRIQKLQAEQQRRELNMSEELSSWAPTSGNDEHVKLGLLDTLHQNLGVRSSQSLPIGDGAPTSSYERKDSSLLFAGSDSPFNLFTDQHRANSFAEVPLTSDSGNLVQNQFIESEIDERSTGLENSEKLSDRDNSGALPDEGQFVPDISTTSQVASSESQNIISSAEKDPSEGKEGKKGKKRSSKSKAVTNKTVPEVQECTADQARFSSTNLVERPGSIPIRPSFLGNTGGSVGIVNVKSEKGVDNAVAEDTINEGRISSTLPKGQDNNTSLRRPPVSRAISSQEVLSELASASTMTRKNSKTTIATPDERKQSVRKNSTTKAPETQTTAAVSKRDVGFRRISSCNDADVLETSFIDMLKSNTRRPTMPEFSDPTFGTSDSSDVAGGRSGKKKGKKGKQIDPTLLGFKVTSNRILMGEIQRPED